MLRIALVGCGTMAESHLTHINRIPYAKLVEEGNIHKTL